MIPKRKETIDGVWRVSFGDDHHHSDENVNLCSSHLDLFAPVRAFFLDSAIHLNIGLTKQVAMPYVELSMSTDDVIALRRIIMRNTQPPVVFCGVFNRVRYASFQSLYDRYGNVT